VTVRHLDRKSIPVPACLAEQVEGRTYSSLSGAEKAEIRTALLNLHGNRCAYCERRTGDAHDEGHIEHFRKQADHRNLTTTWENLYWSCKDEKTCGKHKDNCRKANGRLARFNENDLLDPGIDDPDQFLLFVDDGTVVPRPGTDPDERRRAEETLRVFRLADSAYLKQQREDALRPYKSAVKYLLPLGTGLLAEYVEGERENIRQAPFSAAIRHYLEGIL
jgi:uncharacterized protein (TIGR02646 family)